MTADDMLVAIMLLVPAVLWLFTSNRMLKWKLRTLEKKAAVAASAVPAPALTNDRGPEVEDLRKRIQVLERIATDGNPVLSHEIEALRHA